MGEPAFWSTASRKRSKRLAGSARSIVAYAAVRWRSGSLSSAWPTNTPRFIAAFCQAKSLRHEGRSRDFPRDHPGDRRRGVLRLGHCGAGRGGDRLPGIRKLLVVPRLAPPPRRAHATARLARLAARG